jgi:hypothetical protein
MRTILINDYVSNDTIANELITNFDNNKLVVKGDTGIGGTTSILNITDKSVIIISPLTGMIIGKENKREPHQMFIYKDSKDRWMHFEKEINGNQNVILNTTPEQIIGLRKSNPELFLKVLKIPFFVDEFQVYAESEYREKLNDFYNILFKDHKAYKTLSTATPTYKNLDIPMHILEDMEIITIKREVQREKLVKIEPISNYYNFVKSNCELGNKVILFTNEVKKINNLINSEDFGYKIQTLVGENLGTKLSQFSPKTIEENYLMEKGLINDDIDVYIISTKYLIGFDIEFDAAMGIIMDEGSQVNNFNVNQFVQAYGRIRKKVIDACIFYNSISDDSENIEELVNLIKKTTLDENYLKKIQIPINQINNSFTYPIKNLTKSLKWFGFKCTNLDEVFRVNSVNTTFSEKYRNLINQEGSETFILRKELNHILNNIKGDDKNYLGFSSKYLLLWASAYIALETQSDYLMNYDAERFERLLLRVKTFIDVNELSAPDKMSEIDTINKNRVSKKMQEIAIKEGAFCSPIQTDEMVKTESGNIKLIKNYKETRFSSATNRYYDDTFNKAKMVINSLYAIYLIEEGQYSTLTERIVHGFSTVSQCLIEDYIKALSEVSGVDVNTLVLNDDKTKLGEITKNYAGILKSSGTFKNTTRKISDRLAKLKGFELYNQEEINQIMDKATNIKASLIECKHGIRNTIKMNTYSIRKQVERHKYYVLSHLSMYCAGHTFGFKTTRIDNRIFNPTTKTTRQLRGYTPYQMIQCDIKSAFATFLDEIIGSNIAKQVYNNIEKKKKVNRSQAKKLYNSMLNDYKRNPIEARNFFRICGYTNDQIKEIINLTSKEKGAFYREMTKKEEQAIKNFKDWNDLDETAIRLHDAIIIPNLPKHQNLQSSIGNCEFDIRVL